MKRMSDKAINAHIAKAYNEIHPEDMRRWRKIVFDTDSHERFMEFLSYFDKQIRILNEFEVICSDNGYCMRIPKASSKQITQLRKQAQKPVFRVVLGNKNEER